METTVCPSLRRPTMPRFHYAKTSLHRAPTAHRPPLTDVNGCPVEQLARLAAEALPLYLASRHLARAPKATKA